jgi:rare lipoprotein A
MLRLLLLSPLLLGLVACAYTRPGGYYEDDGPGAAAVDVSRIPDAVPKAEPRSNPGNDPYSVNGVSYTPLGDARGYRERGVASWYGKKFHGRRTSSGEAYDMYAMTAAHKTLPLPSYVRVRNLENGRAVVVRVNDRGPFLHNRLIDLSYAAAAKLGVVGNGTGIVEVEAVTPDDVPVRVAGGAPAAEPPGQAAVEPVPPRLFLQVGAFAQWENANSLRTRLEAASVQPVMIQTAVGTLGGVDGKAVYRVRVGPLASVADSDRLTESIAQLGLGRAIVVVE